MYRKILKNVLTRFGRLTVLGCFLLSFFAGCSDQPFKQASTEESPSSITISEVMSKNISVLTDDDQEYVDWIELYNNGSKDVNLKGYFLTDSTTKTDKWVFPAVKIPAKSYLVIFASGKDRCKAGMIHTNFSISSTGETLRLFDPNHKVICAMDIPPSLPDISYGIVQEDDVDKGKCHWFKKSTPGKINSGSHAESTDKLKFDTVAILINEYMSANTYTLYDEEGDYNDWVELYNPSSIAVSLEGMGLSDNMDDLHKWTFPKNTQIPPKGYTLVYLSGKNKVTKKGEIHTDFKIGSEDTALMLSDTSQRCIDKVSLVSLPENTSYGRKSDNQKEWLYFSRPTPGSINQNGFASLSAALQPFNKGVWINEAVAAVSHSSANNLYDWVELYNHTDKTVDLTGYGLSKNPETPFAYTFGKTTIPPHGYLIVYCAGDDAGKLKNKGRYAPFKIDSSGSTLFLTEKSGKTVDGFYTGKLRIGISVGRSGITTAEHVYYDTPTPGKKNAAKTYATYAAVPHLSLEGGYASAGDTVTVTPASGTTVRYTVDGSNPTAASPAYTSPIKLEKTVTIKYCAFESNKLPSDIVTATYIIGQKHTIPIISLSGDPDGLFGNQHGILANGPGYAEPFPYVGANFWKDWERPVAVEYFVDGKKEVAFCAGAKVFGQYTRAYDQKSLSLHLRDDYGAAEVAYPFFQDNPHKISSDFVLRAGGQDQRGLHIRDAFCAQVMKGHTTLPIMDWQPVAVYLNGQYWGLYGLREKINESYFSSHNGLDENNIDIIKGDTTVLSGSYKAYGELMNYVQTHDLRVKKNYDTVCSQVDIPSFIDYLITEIFFANGDTGNVKCFRQNSKGEKWRWVMFDFDMTMRPDSLWTSINTLKNMFHPVGHGHAHAFSTTLQRALIRNDDFKKQFIDRYTELLNTVFMPDHMIKTLDEMTKQIDSEIPVNCKRWNHTTYTKWKAEVKSLKNIIPKRRELAIKQLNDYFHISVKTK